MSLPLTRTQLCTLQVVQFFRENPDRWCRVNAAMTADGGACSPDWSDAVAFCFIGAWRRLGFAADLCPLGFRPRSITMPRPISKRCS